MKIAFVGDQHKDISNFNKLIDYLENRYNPNLYIQVGDLGLMGNNLDKYIHKLTKKLNQYNKRMLFIEGNHENHKYIKDRIEEYGEKHTEEIALDNLIPFSNNLYYIPKGTLINFDGKTIYFCGGAFSVDRSCRTLNKDYWEEETLTNEQTDIIVNKLNKLTPYSCDILVTHDFPENFYLDVFPNDSFNFSSYSDYMKDKEHKDNLEKIWETKKPKLTICGHYHFRKTVKHDNKYFLEILGCNINNLEEQYYIVNTKDENR